MRRHRPREDNLTNGELEDDDTNEIEENENEFDEKGCLIQKNSDRRVAMYQNIENLNETNMKNLTLKDLVRFATEVARGMDFLASKKV